LFKSIKSPPSWLKKVQCWNNNQFMNLDSCYGNNSLEIAYIVFILLPFRKIQTAWPLNEKYQLILQMTGWSSNLCPNNFDSRFFDDYNSIVFSMGKCQTDGGQNSRYKIVSEKNPIWSRFKNAQTIVGSWALKRIKLNKVEELSKLISVACFESQLYSVLWASWSSSIYASKNLRNF